jgi:sec-independent protein translocase protein TatB
MPAMFDVAWSELLLVAVVAILVVGPKELPGMLRSLGRMLGKLRRTADEFRKHFDEAVREAGGEELQREMKSLKQNNPLNQIRSSLEDAARDPASSSKTNPQSAKSEQSDADEHDDLGPPPPPLPPRNAPETQDVSTAPRNDASESSAATAVSTPENDEERGAPRVNGAHGTAGQGL